MILYNTHSLLNNFGFDDISRQSHSFRGIHSRNIKRATSQNKKQAKLKVSAENIVFLKSLGYKIKNGYIKCWK